MAWTEENTLMFPTVCLARVIERKEKYRKALKMSCLHSEKKMEVDSKEKARVDLVYAS